MGWITASGLGGIVAQHYGSLPVRASKTGLSRHVPWLAGFVGLPMIGGVLIGVQHGAPGAELTNGLLAGVAILGGLLFEVLASVSGRLAALADGMDEQAATEHEINLINRLDIARANIAYTSFVSVLFVVGLGYGSMLDGVPGWVRPLSATVLLHLGLSLVLVLVRISSIGQDDRVSALTARARARSREGR